MFFFGLILVLSEIDSEAVGGAAASIFLPSLLILYGVWKCHVISRRSSANRKCALALMTALLSFLPALLLAALGQKFPSTVVVQIMKGLLILPVVFLPVVALVLGILGLAEYARERGRYTQGRAQAAWALALSALLLSAFCIGVISVLINQAVSSASIPGNDISPVASTPGKTIVDDEMNFSFRPPGRPWVQVNMKKLNKDSRLSFTRPLPEAYVIIIAEALGTESAMDTAQLREIARAHMESASTSTRLIDQTSYGINGLSGMLVKREAQLGSYDFFYTQWFCVTNGFSYQLTAYCNYNNRSLLEAEAPRIFSGFSVTDPHRLADKKQSKFATDFISPSHFYTVEVAHSVWHAFAELKSSFPEAEFGGSRGDSCFAVVPVWLGDRKTDADSLASGLLSTMNIKYPDDDLTNRQEIEDQGAEGLQFYYQRTVDATLYHYRIRTFRKGEFGYLITSWTTRQTEMGDAILNDALGRVKITAPATDNLPEPPQLTPQDLKTQAEVNNQIGLYYFNAEEYEKALPFFKAAAMEQEDSDYLGNLLLDLCRLKQSSEGLAYLQQVSPRLLSNPEIRLYQAYFQSQASLSAEALTNYAGVFGQGYRSDSDFEDYVNLLITSGLYDRALSEVNHYLLGGDSAPVRLLIGDIYRAIPDYEKAVKFLKREHEKTPYDAEVTQKLIRTLLDSGQPNEALDLCRYLVKNDPQSSAAFYLESQCEIKLKWYREAKTSLETALNLEPSDQDTKDSLDYVNGLLGEGSNSMLKNPIDPVLLPGNFNQRALNPPDDSYAQGYGCYYLQSIKAISYARNLEYKTTDYQKIKILDTAGVAAFSTFQVPFDPVYEDIFVNDARVFDREGKLLAQVKPADCYVIDDSSDNAASNKKILNIPIPGLQPGCEISLVITRRTPGPFDEFPFLSQSLSKDYPVCVSAVYLQGDGAGLTVSTTPAIQRETLKEGITLMITNPLVATSEPLQPPTATYLPMIWIADKAWTWSRLATNYLSTIQDRLQPDDTVRIKTRQLVGGLSDERAKAATLSRFVQTNCTYKAIEFGRRSRIPNKAADTLQNAYGDCKDHAVLLQQMLQSAGLSARLALVSSETPVRTDLPSLDQFDHMIVAIQLKDGEKFVDTTSKGSDLAAFIPVGLAGHSALVLDYTNTHFAQLPDYPLDDSTIQVKQQAKIVEDENLWVDESINLTGALGAFLREYLQGISPAYRQESVERDMDIANTSVTNFEVDALDDPRLPIQIKYSFLLKNQFHQTENGLIGKLRAGLESYYLEAAPVTHRLSPFEFTLQTKLNSQVIFSIPKGFHFVGDASLTNRSTNHFLTFDLHRNQDKDQLIYRFNLIRPIKSYSAADYPLYLEAMEQVLSSLASDVVLQKDGI